MSRFTEGPWVMCRRGESLKGASGKDVIIWGCGLTNGIRTDEADANSALIAVAPEMYKMLDDLCKGRGVDYPIEQLLAKARGES
jgi:hypothetical protein